MREKKIYILYGGNTSEREVSLNTGKAMHKALVDAGYENVTLVDFVLAGIGLVAHSRPDICLIALHGKNGEDGTVQGYLQMLGIPYTGSGVAASAVAFDKYLSKLCFTACGIPTADYWMAEDNLNKKAPCVVKPCREGSTVGITIVKDRADYDKAVEFAKKFDTKVIAEEFIEGKELTIGIMDGEVLPTIWIRPKSGFYDYGSKYTKGATDYLFETGLTEEEQALVNETALRAYKALDCEGVARVDIIYDGKTPYVLEVNTIPGMTETSLLPQAAEKAGIAFAELLGYMLKKGLER